MEYKDKCGLNTKLCDILVITLLTLFLTVCFFVTAMCNADDAGTYMRVYQEHDLGSVKYTLLQRIQPLYAFAELFYFLGVGNTGAEMVMYCYAVFYFVCVFFTLTLVMKGTEKNKWILLLAVFMLLPSSDTNKNHLVPTALAIYTLYAVYKVVEEKKKIPAIIAAILFAYVFVTNDDRVILLLFIAFPAVVYAIIWCLQNKDKHKYLYMGGIGVALIAMVVKMVDEISTVVRGHGLTLLEAWGGYGGSEYLTWTDVYTFFDKGIPSIFSTLLLQYNIPIEGGMIQFSSFFWIIRILLVIFMLAIFLIRWKDIIKNGITSISIIDSFSTIAVTALIGINILNGMLWYYDIEDTPMNRYAAPSWFFLVLIMVRWIAEKYKSVQVLAIGKKMLKSGTAIGIILALLIVGYSEPIYLGRDAITLDFCEEELEFLKSYGTQYQCGIGSMWRTTPITAMSNAEYICVKGWVLEEEGDTGNVYFQRSSDPDYNDGARVFNYIIEYPDNSMTMDWDNIEALRGDWIAREYVGDSIIRLYDYDIRWDPELIMEAVGTDYELTDQIEYYFDFPVGVNRIEMEVGNSQNFDLNVLDNPTVSDVNVQILDNDKIYVDVTCLQNTSVTFQVARKNDEAATIHKICLKRVQASIMVSDGASRSEEVYLESGDYVFTFAGEALKNMQLDWQGDNIEVTQLTDGKIRQRYKVHIESPQTIRYTISGDKCQVDKVSYENAVLFED